jgi:DNA-binding SARP family transcriptional activator
VATDDSTPNWSARDRAYLRAATELLSAGQYERLAELLHRVQSAYDRQGDTIPAHVLVLARRICLACSQSQAEAEWHQRACEEAAQREDKLRHQLTTLLDLVGEREFSIVPGEWDTIPQAPIAMLGPPAPDVPEPVEAPRLWQRIQGILHWRPGPQPREEVVSEVPVQGSTSPSLGWAQGRVLSPTEEAETPSRSPAQVAHAQPPSPLQATAAADSSPPKRKREAGTVPPADREKPEEPSPPSLVVYCLGPFRVYQDDKLISDWPSGKGKSIFKYMIANRARPIPKDVLMDLFWRGADPDAARNNLNVAIFGLRQALRAARPDFSHIVFQDDHYLLNPSMALWVDVEEFQEHYEAGRRLERKGKASKAMEEYEVAEGLYQGDFLEEDLYEDWPTLQREGLKDNYLVILDRLSRYYLERKEHTTCIRLCQKILVKDGCREEAHQRLMRCYSRQGQPYLALRQYHRCVERLKMELDVLPMDETIALYQRIRAGQGV